MAKKKPKTSSNTIGLNKKARFDFHIEEDFEAGIALEGWEVKSLRAGRLQLADGYVFVKNGEVFLSAVLITPLQTASTHINPEARRTRKLLLHRREIDKLTGAIDRQGYTIVPLSMYWKRNRVKLKIALAKGKQKHDKRAAIKDRDWQRDKQRIMRGR
ncbi:MAG TPA: SsrA-binding protein SmpB [Gammaproteobacteria bacterium]|nr:SsrA-binding protein SmpB [Gammaproteobacteria bacterium]